MSDTICPTDVLQSAGLANPARVVNLIRKTIAFFQLDLAGLTVLTEAASGPYLVTPVIAVLAGAKRVIALTRDSRYASAEQVIVQTRALESLAGIANVTEIYTARRPDLFSNADIVTNLGFVRPIDRAAVAAMKPSAVVPLMCEAWEFRPDDLDLEACRAKGIPVVATNEDFPGLKVFDYSGILCIKLLLQAQIEVHKSKIVVVSSDKFGVVIERALCQAGAQVRCVRTLRDVSEATLHDVDVLVVADYTRADIIIGREGDIAPGVLADLAPGVIVVQFAGMNAVEELTQHGIAVHPNIQLTPHRMGETLAGLGPRPVIELHAAGLKVGEILAKRNLRTSCDNQIFRDLMQPIFPTE